MSQYPTGPYSPPPHALGYGQYAYAPPGPRRPTSVTVIAVFTIIFGILGLIGVTFQLVQVFIPQAFQFGAPNPVTDVMRTDPVIATWTVATSAAGGVLAIVELAGGVGAMSLKPWARKALLTYAVAVILIGLIGVVFNFAIVLPRLSQIPQNRPEVKMAIQIMPYSAGCGVVVGMILPVCVLVYMNRPNVKAAFAAQGAAGHPQGPTPDGQPPQGGQPPVGPGPYGG